MKRLVIIAIVLSAVAIIGEIFIFSSHKETAEATHTHAITSQYHIYAPSIPNQLTFAEEEVPLDAYYVREGLDRELVSNMYLHSNTILYIKRAARYFPTIEKILKDNDIPIDFKYLCVIESGLQNVKSPAGAGGFWQFMPATGQRYGLIINEEVDMRNNLEASTKAACQYLKYLKERMGSWTMAAAAYNCGENGLERRMQQQGQESYYEMFLNNETQRYVFRILAMKLIFSAPQDYGFHIRHCDLYPQLKYEERELKGQNIDLYQYARDNGTTYKMLRMYNPWLTTDKLKNKSNATYTVHVPTKGGTSHRHLTSNKHNTNFITKM